MLFIIKKVILKKCFFLVLLCFFVLPIIAQDEEFKSFYLLGVKQGANYTSVNFDPSIKTDPHFGYHGGLVFRFQNEKLFALQVELNYSQKGWTENLDTIENSYHRNLDYLELPLMAQVVLGKRPNLKYYLNVGTSFAYLLSEKESFVVNNEDFRREYYEKKIENRFDYSIVAEVGLAYNTGIGEFQFGLRYQITLTDLFEVNDDSTLRGSQNTLWNFSIAYFFLDNR